MRIQLTILAFAIALLAGCGGSGGGGGSSPAVVTPTFVANPNPVVSDLNGKWDIIVNGGLYETVSFDSTGHMTGATDYQFNPGMGQIVVNGSTLTWNQQITTQTGATINATYNGQTDGTVQNMQGTATRTDGVTTETANWSATRNLSGNPPISSLYGEWTFSVNGVAHGDFGFDNTGHWYSNSNYPYNSTANFTSSTYEDGCGVFRITERDENGTQQNYQFIGLMNNNGYTQMNGSVRITSTTGVVTWSTWTAIKTQSVPTPPTAPG